MTQLLRQLNSEIESLSQVGSASLEALVGECDSCIEDLRQVEAELETQLQSGPEGANLSATLEKSTQSWYKASINSLKTYNSQISRFQKTIVGNSKWGVDLDDAYTFPLNLNSYPVKEVALGDKAALSLADGHSIEKSQNRRQLLKSIILHLLKIGHGSIVDDMLDDFQLRGEIDLQVLAEFRMLNGIVTDVRNKHDLTKALEWLKAKKSSPGSRYEKVSFKFHMLQFVLLLAGSPSYDTTMTSHFDADFAAYTYAKEHFPVFVKDYISEISPIISLLLFNYVDGNQHSQLLVSKIKHLFVHTCERSKRVTKETEFVAEILGNFDKIHEQDSFFFNLANEFVAEFCSDMSLSSDSSLFQSVLAGFVNLPNFYKYSKLQKKLRKPGPEAATWAGHDLPFLIPDKTQFLFNYHPIFICPVSKEQLVPVVSVVKVSESEIKDRKRKQIFISPNEALVPPTNPVVVFEHCRHLALKDSVRHLTKGGAEVFKCHYCYKKHKLSDVSDAYFIDL